MHLQLTTSVFGLLVVALATMTNTIAQPISSKGSNTLGQC